ncbi:MAG TPA: hypothetical protein VE089_08465 [Nitrososphaeraceae archaeon]|nr:hypothetical protein [Nitrososphaeraceae archaeon]
MSSTSICYSWTLLAMNVLKKDFAPRADATCPSDASNSALGELKTKDF